jgi:hypothetical protein
VKHRWHPSARVDYEGAVDYYLTQASPAIARKLDPAVNHALHLILEYPELGQRLRRLQESPLCKGFHTTWSTGSKPILSLSWPCRATVASLGIGLGGGEVVI